MAGYSTYATVDQLKVYLQQFQDTSAENGALTDVLERATAIITTSLGFRLTPAAVGSQVVYGDGGTMLEPPLFVTGSVTSVTAPSSITVPAYVESDGALLIKNSTTGVLGSNVYPRLYPYGDSYQENLGAWAAGVPYTVAATFGASDDDMLVAEQMCLEVAVRLWRFRDAGGSAAIGAEGGVVIVKSDFSPMVQHMLDQLRGNTVNQRIGIW